MHRILLESSLWEQNAFVTLSYDNNSLTFSDTGFADLVPRDVQLFLKRLRFSYKLPLRFFAVGEYGDVSQRPHYHLALFNFPACASGRTLRVVPSTRPVWWQCCPACRLVGEAWDKGDIDLGRLEPHSAGYVAGYVTKKMTGKHDARLKGRYPEFARMSLRPGIGYGVLANIAAVLVQHGLDKTALDVPTVLRHGGKQLPLGRYLRRKLRVIIGRDEKCPQEVIDALQAEMQDLRASVEDTLWHPTMRKFRKEAIKQALIDQNMGLRWSAEAREGIRKRRSL